MLLLLLRSRQSWKTEFMFLIASKETTNGEFFVNEQKSFLRLSQKERLTQFNIEKNSHFRLWKKLKKFLFVSCRKKYYFCQRTKKNFFWIVWKFFATSWMKKRENLEQLIKRKKSERVEIVCCRVIMVMEIQYSGRSTFDICFFLQRAQQQKCQRNFLSFTAKTFVSIVRNGPEMGEAFWC